MSAAAGAQPLDVLLADLDPTQREAVEITTGPLAILAGAGSGKTRVISRRAAHAIATEAVEPGHVLLVTFTDKAAKEMVARMAALGFPGVMARTFHAMALSQLSFFWPRFHDGRPLPQLLPSKGRLVVPLQRALPGRYSYTPVKDLADTIEWAKVRRITPKRWEKEGGDRAPIPPDLFARLYEQYERDKTRAGFLDFEDLLVETVRLLESDEEAAALVRSRKSWFSVDEYQDTNPLSERLLELWMGDSRNLCVVGDPDQTIYTFTGATPSFLLDFGKKHRDAKVVRLLRNYRSTPQVLELANRLTHGGPRGDLVATRPDGLPPLIRSHADEAEETSAIANQCASLIGQGTPPSDIAVLVRINAQIPVFEEAFTRAGVPYRAGVRFFARRDVREARRLIERMDADLAGAEFAEELRELFTDGLGWGLEDGGGAEARERDASLDLLVEIADGLVAADLAAGPRALLDEIRRREAAEAAGDTEGVELLTYHRAKGLEWPVVFLPALEEGLLPIRQAKAEEEVAEERRLLYVGITRAEDRLVLSWARSRPPGAGKEPVARTASRFLEALRPKRAVTVPAARRVRLPDAVPAPLDDARAVLLETLKSWRRERARADGVPPYVIAPDTTLAGIVEALPDSPAALRRVHGMGPLKVERYGAEILYLVAAAR